MRGRASRAEKLRAQKRANILADLRSDDATKASAAKAAIENDLHKRGASIAAINDKMVANPNEEMIVIRKGKTICNSKFGAEVSPLYEALTQKQEKKRLILAKSFNEISLRDFRELQALQARIDSLEAAMELFGVESTAQRVLSNAIDALIKREEEKKEAIPESQKNPPESRGHAFVESRTYYNHMGNRVIELPNGSSKLAVNHSTRWNPPHHEQKSGRKSLSIQYTDKRPATLIKKGQANAS